MQVMLIVTSFSTAILAILLVVLSILTVIARGKFKVALSDNGELALLKFIRAHGNLAEFAPIFLILLTLVEVNHFISVSWLWMTALVFIFGRFLHATSLLFIEPKTLKLRVFAMVLTFTPILMLALVLIFKLITNN
jgi:uncharacterized membrane protein YecN with MAPEG domain